MLAACWRACTFVHRPAFLVLLRFRIDTRESSSFPPRVALVLFLSRCLFIFHLPVLGQAARKASEVFNTRGWIYSAGNTFPGLQLQSKCQPLPGAPREYAGL